ncbi:MAG: hypothetical protein A2017_13910 [Lentisphaerae bacterium GWF2_44_16]|nr:MAG: hypothetical protein A2017_13910 [Lentisphaerae bacterium GWF2_44_16]
MEKKFLTAAIICWILPSFEFLIACAGNPLDSLLKIFSYLLGVYALLILKKILASKFAYTGVHLYINVSIIISGLLLPLSFYGKELVEIFATISIFSVLGIINLIIFSKLIFLKTVGGKLWKSFCLSGIFAGLAGTLLILSIPLNMWHGHYLGGNLIAAGIYAFWILLSNCNDILMGFLFFKIFRRYKNEIS